MANQPDTMAILTAIQAYMQAITWGSSQQFALVQIEEIKDVTNLVATGGACLELYGVNDDSQHKAFGGKVMDEQTFMLLALVSKDTPTYAQQIYSIRDALVVPFQVHATLGGAGTVYHSQVKSNTGLYLDVRRNAQWLRGYRIHVLVKSEWFVQTPPGVIS